jgi:cellulose synthase/poly-beta-1,6-N-acetylglucosamine synthase-like glycosyltransferase
MLFTYAGYPLWIYFLSRWHPQPWRQESILPTVSIILAVHNGASLIRRQIDRLLAFDYPANLINLVVVSDGSTDGTGEIMKRIHDSAVKSVTYLERRGKAAAVNIGLENATGEIVLFVDIRPRPARNSLKLLVSNFADPRVGCVTGELVLVDENHSGTAKAVGGLYWRYEQWIRKCESQVDSPLGVYGGFYAVRRELARPLPDATILDDMLQPLNVIRQGYRSVIDARARVYDVWPKSLEMEFDRKVRTLAGNFQLLQLAPWLISAENRLRFNLISHKLLRLIVPVLLIVMLGASAILAFHSRAYTSVLVLQVLLYLIASAGGWRGVSAKERACGAARAFCMLNVAVVVGFYKFVTIPGPLWKVWIPTAPLLGTIPNEDAIQEATKALMT